MTRLKEAVARLFGPLVVRPSPFYSEVSGEVLWSVDKKTTGGNTYRIVFNFTEAHDTLPAACVADLWWDAPAIRSTLSMEKPSPISPEVRCPNVFETEADVSRYHTDVETQLLPKIDETHAGMVERAAALRKKS